MDKRGYKVISAAVDGLEGDVMVTPWPLNMGPIEEIPADFDANSHLADDADARFIEVSFNRGNRAARVLNALNEAGLMAVHGSEAPGEAPCLKLLGIIHDEAEGVTSLTLEDLSAR